MSNKKEEEHISVCNINCFLNKYGILWLLCIILNIVKSPHIWHLVILPLNFSVRCMHKGKCILL